MYGVYLQFFRGVAMRAALRVSTKSSSSYDGYYIKFNPALFSRSSNFEDAKGAFHLSLNITHSFTESLIILFEPRIFRPDIECLVDFSCFQHVNITPFAFTRSIGDIICFCFYFSCYIFQKLENC